MPNQQAVLLIGGPCDGQRRILATPLPPTFNLHVFEPLIVSATPPPPDAPPPHVEIVVYVRMVMRWAEPTIVIYAHEVLSYEAALERLIAGYRPEAADGR